MQRYSECSKTVCIVGCSPRHGNTDTLCSILAQGFAEQCRTQTIFLRDKSITPCIACGHCALPGHHCPLDARDNAGQTLDTLRRADLLVVVSPVFFYGIPAQAKALVDRSQRLWMEKEQRQTAPDCTKTSLVCLVAARPQGDNLFQGSFWTLHYFLEALGFKKPESLFFPGFDTPTSLAADKAALARALAQAQRMAQTLQCAE